MATGRELETYGGFRAGIVIPSSEYFHLSESGACDIAHLAKIDDELWAALGARRTRMRSWTLSWVGQPSKFKPREAGRVSAVKLIRSVCSKNYLAAR